MQIVFLIVYCHVSLNWVNLSKHYWTFAKQRTCTSFLYYHYYYCYNSKILPWFDPLPVLLRICSPVNLCLRRHSTDQIPCKKKQLHWLWLLSGFHNPGKVLNTCALFLSKYIYTRNGLTNISLLVLQRGHVVTRVKYGP